MSPATGSSQNKPYPSEDKDTAEKVGGQSYSHLEHTDVLPSPPRWSTTLSSSYYDLQGARSANNNLYSYGAYTVFSEDLKITYSLAPRWSLALTAQYLSNYAVVNVGRFSLPFHTSGLGDTYLEAIHPLWAEGPWSITADGGVSLPTGSISEQNENAPNLHDAYFLQLGSGTVDGLAGLTTLYRHPLFMAGNRFFADVRTGNNAEGYHLGNMFKADGWLDVPLKYGFTPRFLGYYRFKGGMTGWDPTLPRQPLTEVYYHNQADWDMAVSLRYQLPLWSRLSFFAEAALPFYYGMSNSDNLLVKTNYYGTLALTGQL